MSFPRMRAASDSMERKPSHNSKVEERQRTNMNNCAESLISVDSSRAGENKLSSSSLLAERVLTTERYHLACVAL